jgi:hypothetical protein
VRRLLLAGVLAGPPIGLVTVLAYGAVRATALRLADRNGGDR